MKKPDVNHHPRTAAMILAAGDGLRMGDMAGSKLLLENRGRPLISYAVASIETCELIDEILLVVRKADVGIMREIAQKFSHTKVTAVVPGGPTRQKSAMCGLSKFSVQPRFLLIHDGARPLVRPSHVEAVLLCCYETGAAALGVPVSDTVKEVSADGTARKTIDRAMLWLAQTPQAFDYDLYAGALHLAERDGAEYTDDCQLLERLGRGVRMVEGQRDNIKLTTREDYALLCGALGALADGNTL